MKKQNKTYITSAVIAIVIAFVLSLGVGYISAVNSGAAMENSVIMLQEDSENKLSNYTTKIQEQVQIPKMYTKELKEVIKNTFEGRYGANGSQALMQWIQEQNPVLDSSLYKDLMVTINAGRDEFRISQTRKLQACRQYKTALATFWQGFWLKQAGYPKENLATICQVVSDARTSDIFKVGQQEPIKFD